MTDSSPWAVLLARLARPRLPGSDGVAETERMVGVHLAERGWTLERQGFTTSPRRLVAVALAGAGGGWLGLIAVPLLVLPVPTVSAILTVTALSAGLVLLVVGVASGRFPIRVRSVDAVNLIADRGGPVRIWLVAHLDSKSQGVSLRGRVVAVALTGTGMVLLSVAVVVRLVMVLPFAAAAVPLILLVTGGALLSRHPIRDGSPGAVDNASGIIAVLAAAEALAHRDDVGILLTGAEEFGLEGARHWVQRGGRGEVFVNFDGIDVRGPFNVMPHGRAAAGPAGLAETLADELGHRGFPVRRAALPLGIVVDGRILAGAGMGGVTVSRGDWSTLGVIHTPRDTADRTGTDAAVAAGKAAAAALDRTLG